MHYQYLISLGMQYLALQSTIENQIFRLVKGVLERVYTIITEISWALLIVTEDRGNRHVRICGNFKSTIDPYINPVQYPLPWFTDTIIWWKRI